MDISRDVAAAQRLGIKCCRFESGDLGDIHQAELGEAASRHQRPHLVLLVLGSCRRRTFQTQWLAHCYSVLCVALWRLILPAKEPSREKEQQCWGAPGISHRPEAERRRARYGIYWTTTVFQKPISIVCGLFADPVSKSRDFRP